MMNETVISTIRGLTEVLESALILNKHKKYTTKAARISTGRNSERMCSMDVQEIHEMLKKMLSPEDYINLLKLMIKDIEIIIEWGRKVEQSDFNGEVDQGS